MNTWNGKKKEGIWCQNGNIHLEKQLNFWKIIFELIWLLTLVGGFLVGVCRYGLDLINGETKDNKKAGVLEPTMSKVKSLKFATEAAITILRIDDMIRLQDDPSPRGGGDDCCD